MAQNASKILQEAFKTTSSKLVELERQHHKLEQYTRRECLDFSGIPNSVAPKDLENFILGLCRKLVLILTNRILLLVIGWERQTERLSSSWIRRMLKMFIQIRRNWKMLFLVCFPTICKAETIWPQEVKMIGGREGGLSRKRKIFVSPNLCPYYRHLYGLVKEKKAEGLIFYFWVFNRTIRMKELEDSCVIKITHESDIWYFFSNFLDKTSLLCSFAFFTVDSCFVIVCFVLLCS